MKRIQGWTLLGAGGVGLTALLLSQAVCGQPDVKAPLPAPPVVGQLPLPLPSVTVEMPSSTPFSGPLPAPERRTDPLLVAAASATNAFPTEAPAGKQQPAVSVEWVAPANIRIHQPMACQIVVQNHSSVPVHQVVIRHRPCANVIYKSTEPKATDDAGELTWNLGTMRPGQTQRIQLYLVPQARGPLNCQATATFTALAGHHIDVREPHLAIKMHAPEKIILGDTVTFKATIRNTGDCPADAVKTKIHLPDGLEHPYGKVIEFEVGSLGPNESKLLQMVCTAKAGGAQKLAIRASGEGNINADDAIHLDILVPKIDVAIAGPKLRYLDRHAIYLVKVTNPGTAPATKVELNQQIPPGFKFHQASHGGKYVESVRQVAWTLSEIPPGESREVAVELIPVEVGDHRFIAKVNSAHGLKAEAEARTAVEGLPSLLMEVAHIDDPIEVGAETAYEIRVANTGPKTESNIEVVCTLPDQLEFRTAKCSTPLRFRQEGHELIFEPLPRLAPKADVIYRIQVKGIAPGDIRFRTRIRADGLKDPMLREESTRIYSDDSPVRAASFNTVPSPVSVPPRVPVPAPLPAPPVPLPTPLPLPRN